MGNENDTIAGAPKGVAEGEKTRWIEKDVVCRAGNRIAFVSVEVWPPHGE